MAGFVKEVLIERDFIQRALNLPLNEVSFNEIFFEFMRKVWGK